jgi:hypothetical protein
MKTLRAIRSVSLSETRWLAYATAGAASALGVSRSAEAEIHYSGLVNIELEGHFNQNHYSVFLPLTNGASLLFTEFYFTSARAYFFVRGGQQGSALAFFTYSNCRALQKLEKGDPIRSCDNCSNPRHFASVAGFPGRGGIMGYQIGHGHFFCYSSLECNAGGIIGFKFNAGNGPQFGWARILGPDAYHHYRYEIKEYAWADPGERIVAGQRSSTELGSVSEMGSLGLLAFGAQGLDAWRTQRMPRCN